MIHISARLQTARPSTTAVSKGYSQETALTALSDNRKEKNRWWGEVSLHCDNVEMQHIRWVRLFLLILEKLKRMKTKQRFYGIENPVMSLQAHLRLPTLNCGTKWPNSKKWTNGKQCSKEQSQRMFISQVYPAPLYIMPYPGGTSCWLWLQPWLAKFRLHRALRWTQGAGRSSPHFSGRRNQSPTCICCSFPNPWHANRHTGEGGPCQEPAAAASLCCKRKHVCSCMCVCMGFLGALVRLLLL